MKKAVLLIVFIISLGLISCSKERHYEFIVRNETAYHLNNIKFGCGENATEVATGANSSSTPFSITFKKSIASLFAEPLLCITVRSYSDSTKTFENTRGQVVSERSLKEGTTNYVVIELDSLPVGKDIFSMRIE
jgi:hypothetical protein